MKKLTVYISFCFTLVGCAEFDFFQGAFSTTTSLQVLTPVGGSALVPATLFTITGTCDPLGGNVDITGNSFSEPSVSGICDPVLGTFSINATAAASGQNLDIQATQLDSLGSLLNANVNTIMIHCAGLAMRTCSVTGSGNPVDPYIVSNITCLQEMRVGLSCHYALNNNIDASATSTWNFDGTNFRGWEPVPVIQNAAIRFTGTLDGRNRTISNLYVTPRDINGSGFFTRLFDEGNGIVDDQVFDLTFSNPTANLFDVNNSSFGFLAGRSSLVGVRNVDVINANIDLAASADREYFGLLVGESINSNFSNSQTSGSFSFNGSFDDVNTKYGRIGGFIGEATGGIVTNSSSDVTMTSNLANVQYLSNIGGAFGIASGLTVNGFTVDANMDLIYVGVNAFASRGISGIGGLTGLSQDGSSYSQICITHNFDLETTNSIIEEVGGHVGRMATAPLLELNNQIGVRGVLVANTNGGFLQNTAAYVGTDFGPSNHSNVFLDSDITIQNSSTPGFDGYGAISSRNAASVNYSNIVTVGSNAISAGITPIGGAFSSVNGATVGSIFYANDIALGGYPAEGSGGPTAGITSNSFAGLAGLPNGSYTGFDFVSVWQRDGGTNIPELRYCP